MADTILVTGARGFVGRALCEALRRTGRPFVGVARSLRDRPPCHPEHLIEADIERVDWRPLLAGIGVVVHLAGRSGDNVGVDRYMAANRDTTRRLAEACVAAGVRRVVFVSSIKVCGETSRVPLGPDAPAQPADAYAHSKAAAEQALREVLQGSDVEGVVLRPPLIYGPGTHGNFSLLVNAVARGWPLPLAGVSNRRSLLYVGNAVSALEASVSAPGLGSHAWPLADDESVSTPELVRRIARALGVRPRLFRVPNSVLRAMASLMRRPGTATRLVDSLEVDAAPFRARTGWSPLYSLDDAIAASVRPRSGAP